MPPISVSRLVTFLHTCCLLCWARPESSSVTHVFRQAMHVRLVSVQVTQLTLERILQQHAAVITQATTLAPGRAYGSLSQQQQHFKSRLHALQHAQQQQPQQRQQQLLPADCSCVTKLLPVPLLLQLGPAQQLQYSSNYHGYYQQQQQQQLCAHRQVRHYHPATHAARALTSRLLQQRTWQVARSMLA